jgi:NAD(P)-dependent dehydrogenase (short-subunit alcohol dehydrogenase family)
MLLATAGCSRGSAAPGKRANPLDRTLVYARSELPPEQNAFPLWTNAMARLNKAEMSDDLKSAFDAAGSFKTNVPLSEVSGMLAEWLGSKQDVSALIERALVMRIQCPLPKLYGNFESFGGVSGWIDLIRLQIVTGRLSAERGAFGETARSYLDVVKMGRCMTESESLTVMYLVGGGVQGIGLSAVRRLCAEERTPVAVMRQTLERLPAPSTKDHALAHVYDLERAFSAAAIPATKRWPGQSLYMRLHSSLALDVRATVGAVEQLYGVYQANARCATFAACDRSLYLARKPGGEFDYMTMISYNGTDWVEGFTRLKDAIVQPNLLGKGLIDSHLGAADNTLKGSFKYRSYLNLTRAFIALRILRKEMGAYPDSLDEIVRQDLLPEVPVDFFDGKPLRYSAEKRLLWSVGDDGTDDGGVEKRDLVVTLPE